MIGIVCNKYICSFLKFIPCILLISILTFVFYYLFYCSKRKFREYIDRFLLFLPIITCIGFLLPAYYQMNNQLPEHMVECDVVLEGKVSNILNKTALQEIYVSDVLIVKGKERATLSSLVIQDPNFNLLTIGDRICYQGKITQFDSATNPGQFDSRAYYQAMGVYYRVWDGTVLHKTKSKIPVYRYLQSLKRKMSETYQKMLTTEDSEILHAMILGDKSELNADTKTLYQKAGISHILAISGLHISMIGLFLFKCLKKIGLHHNVASVLCIILIYLYGIMTGFSISTNRAVIMMILSLSACLFQRSYDSKSAIALSALCILLQQPNQLFQCGFLLSYLAVIGVVSFYPICVEYLKCWFPDFERRMEMKEKAEYHSAAVFLDKLTKGFRKSLFVSCVIQFLTLPIMLWFYYEFACLAPIVNLFILPLSSFLVLMSLLIGLFGSIFPAFGFILCKVVHIILVFYQIICEIFQGIPWNRVLLGRPRLWQIFGFFVCIILFYMVVVWKKTKIAGMFLILASCLLLCKVPEPPLQITMLDVGQGDSIFMKTSEGVTFLVDGGSSDTSAVGTYRILPFLKYSGVKKLDYCFLTHLDVDHISGVEELIRDCADEIEIKHLVLANLNYQEEAYVKMVSMAEQAGIKVIYVERGSKFQAGDLSLTCLHPSCDFPAEDRNAASIVLEVMYKEFSLLLTGDVDEAGERAILESQMLARKQYDILKIAHHGSKYSTCEEWLERVSPKVGLISCGKENRYGHPHVELIERLDTNQVKQKVTTKCGAIHVETDGNIFRISSYIENTEAEPYMK